MENLEFASNFAYVTVRNAMSTINSLFFIAVISMIYLRPFGALGQSITSYEKAAEKALQTKHYSDAAYYFQLLLQKRPDNPSYQFQLAEALYQDKAFEKAATLFEKISPEDSPGGVRTQALLRLGQIRWRQGNYNRASLYLHEYLAQSKGDTTQEALKAVQAIQWAEHALRRPSLVQSVRHLGKEINSAYSDFSPFLRGDTLYYASYRFPDRQEGRRSRILYSIKNGRSREVGKKYPFGDSLQVAHMAMTDDGNFLFFNLCKQKPSQNWNCTIWFSEKNKMGRWKKPIQLPEPINLSGYTATQLSISRDPFTHRQMLWFASDRPGGAGKMDIWQTELDSSFFCPCRLKNSGNTIATPPLATPMNMTAVNTPENEATPFYFPTDSTLYFSSEGWPGFGGYDIYMLLKGDTTLNMGSGINSGFDDLYFIRAMNQKNGYFSSNRTGSFYLDEQFKNCCFDLYAFELAPVLADTAPLLPPTLVQIEIPDDTVATTPMPISVPTDADLREYIGTTLFFDNDEPDRRTTKTVTKQSYDETFTKYMDRWETYRDAFTKGITGDERLEAEQQLDAFFETELEFGYQRLLAFADQLLSKLSVDKARITVHIKGYTSPRAASEYNYSLGKRRISSVVLFFDRYANGALLPYLKTGQLKVEETSFGELKTKAGISDRIDDERNSIYHPVAARERRVEIVEITVEQ